MLCINGAHGECADTINGHFKLDRTRLYNGISHRIARAKGRVWVVALQREDLGFGRCQSSS